MQLFNKQQMFLRAGVETKYNGWVAPGEQLEP